LAGSRTGPVSLERAKTRPGCVLPCTAGPFAWPASGCPTAALMCLSPFSRSRSARRRRQRWRHGF